MLNCLIGLRNEAFKLYRTNLRKSIKNAKRTYLLNIKIILEKLGKH